MPYDRTTIICWGSVSPPKAPLGLPGAEGTCLGDHGPGAAQHLDGHQPTTWKPHLENPHVIVSSCVWLGETTPWQKRIRGLWRLGVLWKSILDIWLIQTLPRAGQNPLHNLRWMKFAPNKRKTHICGLVSLCATIAPLCGTSYVNICRNARGNPTGAVWPFYLNTAEWAISKKQVYAKSPKHTEQSFHWRSFRFQGFEWRWSFMHPTHQHWRFHDIWSDAVCARIYKIGLERDTYSDRFFANCLHFIPTTLATRALFFLLFF